MDPTHKDSTTQHTQRQDRDGMKKCHGVMMGPGSWGRHRRGRGGGCSPSHTTELSVCLSVCLPSQESWRLNLPQGRLWPLGWLGPLRSTPCLLLSRLGAGLCPVSRRGRSAEPTSPHNQPRRAGNYRMLARARARLGPPPPLQPARAVSPKTTLLGSLEAEGGGQGESGRTGPEAQGKSAPGAAGANANSHEGPVDPECVLNPPKPHLPSPPRSGPWPPLPSSTESRPSGLPQPPLSSRHRGLLKHTRHAPTSGPLH